MEDIIRVLYECIYIYLWNIKKRKYTGVRRTVRKLIHFYMFEVENHLYYDISNRSKKKSGRYSKTKVR